MPFIGVPFVPFLGTDQIIEKGPSYHTGGVTTLMSVGDPLEGLSDIHPVARIAGGAALGGALAYYVLEKEFEGTNPVTRAIIGATVGGLMGYLFFR